MRNLNSLRTASSSVMLCAISACTPTDPNPEHLGSSADSVGHTGTTDSSGDSTVSSSASDSLSSQSGQDDQLSAGEEDGFDDGPDRIDFGPGDDDIPPELEQLPETCLRLLPNDEELIAGLALAVAWYDEELESRKLNIAFAKPDPGTANDPWWSAWIADGLREELGVRQSALGGVDHYIWRPELGVAQQSFDVEFGLELLALEKTCIAGRLFQATTLADPSVNIIEPPTAGLFVAIIAERP